MMLKYNDHIWQIAKILEQMRSELDDLLIVCVSQSSYVTVSYESIE